ncbi:MAG: sugar ABC transporter permease [Lachnospiraceae bacterium]|nr:sugar ABC transporter permease [Lachnospiraceae bacterium]MBR4145257.1 sugar ABC transporter permease [Lachnospiraceae bacterium]MBR4781551.1 sugar ABC transporter permease [Lachnospiraceae bacterium]
MGKQKKEIDILTASAKRKKRKGKIEFLYILPFVLLVAVFSYYPLYGWIYAFYDYRPPYALSQVPFVGLKWFRTMIENEEKVKDILRVIRNTFAMSGISMLFSWFPMIFAVFLNEIKCRPFKKFVQTVTTLPNFISWVLVYSIAFSVLSTTGAVNSFLSSVITDYVPKDFLSSSEHVWFTQWLWLTWKNAGWAAIMYIAAITGIDESLTEAARIDGASRMQIIRHITLPSILPTYFVLVMLNLANFLSNGMEQYYVFQNSFNREYIEVLDLYVYNLKNMNGYSLSTAISILKTVISITLLGLTNKISKLIRGEGFI